MKKQAVVFLMIFALVCKETPPEPPTPATLSLRVEDASCTEAWLKVSLADANEPRTVAIKRDGTTVLTARLTANDTTLVDTSLLPKRSYTYQAIRLNNNSPVDTSPTLQVTTMDTTSHSFQFSIDTLGVTSSVLYDVAIVNDTLAYAVGEMYLRDSTGQIDPIFYNLAKWNGRQWTLQKILYNGGPFVNRWILVFNENDIWVNEHVHWDGRTWSFLFVGDPIFAGVRTNKAWGTSSTDFYVVGDGGFIAHYHSGTWQRVESGTTIEISDIYGAMNQRTSSWEIIAAAGNPFVGPERRILRVNGTSVTALSDSGINRAISGIWFVPGKRFWVVGDGMWYSNYFPNSFHWQNKSGTWTPFALTKIRGNDANDVFTVGSYSEVLHYNGVSIRSFRGPTGTDGLYWSVATKGDRIMVVGEVPPRAVVLRGMRVR